MPPEDRAAPQPYSNQQYEVAIGTAIRRALADGVTAMAFDNFFLEKVRRYRETQFAGTGLAPLFPLWGLPTTLLAREMASAWSAP
jgi:hypothetical protein